MPGLGVSDFAGYAVKLMKTEKIASMPQRPHLKTAVLVLDDSNTLSFAGTVDPMRAANRAAGRTVFDWQFFTATGAPARLTSGITVPGPALARLEACDLLLVVAGFGLDRHATPALRASLRRIAGTGATVAGIDGGPWLMADAGLLDGYAATTHWEDLDRLAAQFPDITVLRDRYHIDGARMTCGGAMPALDMMLALIERHWGAALAARVAGLFIHDSPAAPNRAQTRSAPRHAHSPLTARAAALMEQHLENPLPIAALARRLGISHRTLELQFQRQLGHSPKAHYMRLRLDEARRLVTDTDRPLLDIGLATGFASPSSFARAFRSAHGLSARELRADRRGARTEAGRA